MKKFFLLAALGFAVTALVGCGTATLKVSNQSSYSIESVWFDILYVFTGPIASGGTTAGVKALGGDYTVTFYRYEYDSYNGWWWWNDYEATDKYTVTSGLFSDVENTWTYSDSTSKIDI